MSHVSDLLNPAPSSQPPLPADTPLSFFNAQDHRTSPVMSSHPPSVSHVRQSSLSSPGLEALAAAASNIAPLMSPTQKPSPTMSTTFQQGPNQSKRGSLPAYVSQHSTFSLEQYHFPNDERRMSSGEPLPILPPLQKDTADLHSPPVIEPGEQPSETNGMNTEILEQSAPQSVVKDQHQGAEMIPASDLAQSSLAPAMNGQNKIQVKTEMTDNLLKAQDEEKPPLANGSLAAPTTVPESVCKDAPDSLLKPKPSQSKKRAAPKKGMASAVKPAVKKRKIDNESIDGSTSVQRSGTPATSRASITPAPKNRKQTSMTPTRSSSVLGGDDDDYDEDTARYCLCRKPDDHDVMIGCDGPCEDWFHLKCVDMDKEKVDLISRWYCPNCAAQGNETLWKRVCRFEGCRKPARTGETGEKSKYCSDEHGKEFMKKVAVSNTPEKKGANTKRKQNSDRTDPIDGFDEDAYLRGGILKPGELKTLIAGAGNVAGFRKLGDGVLNPTANPDGEKKTSYTDEEVGVLEHIWKKREEYNGKKAMLADRDKFVLMVETRRKAVLAEMKEKDKSLKDICGYDSRLTWSEEEFNQWRASEGGTKMLKSGFLEPRTMTEPENGIEEEEKIGRDVCKKKRCERHRQWLKLQQQDNAFEKDQVRQALKRLEGEEKGVRDRAMIRTLEGEQADGQAEGQA